MRKLVAADSAFTCEDEQKILAKDQVADLQNQLKIERLRSDLYKKIIELAQQQFDINIEKNMGPGSSKTTKRKRDKCVTSL